ncbi:hypothetical protein N0V90_007886 [Kalmusia sp. IMI 367209]|nr:hypothetical protein N0V90_007886 [Kalmusia sp. IMI 367209]
MPDTTSVCRFTSAYGRFCRTWVKTSDNCYISQYDIEESAGMSSSNGNQESNMLLKHYQTQLNFLIAARSSNLIGQKAMDELDADDLDDCGPLDSEKSKREPPETDLPTPTSAVEPPIHSTPVTASTAELATPVPPPLNQIFKPTPSLHRRFLYNTTIGEEYVNCTVNSTSTDRAHGIKRVYEFDQAVYPQCGTVDHDVIMLFTTDFCWIRDDECWEQLLNQNLRADQFPHCEEFTDEVS